MRRREFIAGIASTAAWPIVAPAQPRTLVIGFLFPFGLTTPIMRPYLAAFRHGLHEGGFV
jgi:hypothetical protein